MNNISVICPAYNAEDNLSRCISSILANECVEVTDRINLQLHCATFRTSMLRKAKVNLPEHCMYTDLPLSLLGFCNATTVLSTPLHLYC